MIMTGIFVGLRLPDSCLTGEKKPRKNLIQETCTDRESNPGQLRDRSTCYRLLYSAGQLGIYRYFRNKLKNIILNSLYQYKFNCRF